MGNAKGDFIWYELLTRDADAAQRFYGDVVGWTARDSGQPGMDYRILDARDGQAGGMMQINDQMPDVQPVWLGYVAVPDVDAAVADWAAAGGSVQLPAMDIPDVGRMAMLADPDGIPLYVMRGAVDAISTVFRVAGARHVRWNEIAAKTTGLRLRSTKRASVGTPSARCRWARWARTTFSPPTGSTSAR